MEAFSFAFIIAWRACRVKTGEKIREKGRFALPKSGADLERVFSERRTGTPLFPAEQRKAERRDKVGDAHRGAAADEAGSGSPRTFL